MRTPTEEYDATLRRAFQKVLATEQIQHEAEGALQKATAALELEVAEAAKAVRVAWGEVATIMNAAGVVEEIIEGGTTNYKIAYVSPPRKVSIPDENAVPEEFVKQERRIKKKELAEYLKELENCQKPLPNWAGWERGDPKLGWKPVKKG